MKIPQAYCYAGYRTPFGVGAVAASDQGVCRVWLPGDDLSLVQLQVTPGSTAIREAAQQLEQYFHNRLQQFDIVVDISGMTAFQQQVLQLTRQIPYGTVCTYGELARLAGSPKGARAVGRALGANPVPVVIPCHRIVAADGAPTGFSATLGLQMKNSLLRMEGVEIQSFNTGVWRVVMNNKKS